MLFRSFHALQAFRFLAITRLRHRPFYCQEGGGGMGRKSMGRIRTGKRSYVLLHRAIGLSRLPGNYRVGQSGQTRIGNEACVSDRKGNHVTHGRSLYKIPCPRTMGSVAAERVSGAKPLPQGSGWEKDYPKARAARGFRLIGGCGRLSRPWPHRGGRRNRHSNRPPSPPGPGIYRDCAVHPPGPPDR